MTTTTTKYHTETITRIKRTTVVDGLYAKFDQATQSGRIPSEGPIVTTLQQQLSLAADLACDHETNGARSNWAMSKRFWDLVAKIEKALD